MNDHPIARWHKLLEHRNPKDLEELLAEDAVFLSPIVHKPQQGRSLTIGYLTAALKVLLRPLKAINLVHERMAAMLEASRAN